MKRLKHPNKDVDWHLTAGPHSVDIIKGEAIVEDECAIELLAGPLGFTGMEDIVETKKTPPQEDMEDSE